MKEMIVEIRKELRAKGKKEYRESALRFFKEATQHHGWRNADVNALAAKYYKLIREEGKEKIFKACEELWSSGYMEEALIACRWSYNVRKQFTKEDLKVFEQWIGKYVTNWATCDTFCNKTVGALLTQHPELVKTLFSWTKSKNRWFRRAAAVSLIVPTRKGEHLEESLKIAGNLLEDEDDMVQKGYGWLLKVQSETHTETIFDFVQQHKKKMPRTALRYAIEKLPVKMREEAMRK